MTQNRVAHEPDALLRVLEVTRDLAVPVDLTEVLKHVVNAGRQVLGADRGTVLLYDAATRELYSSVGESFRFSVDEGISGDSARNRRTNYVADCSTDPRFYPQIDTETGYTTRTILTVPLFGPDQELVGVMTMLNPAKGLWDEQDIRLSEILASQAAVALQRALLLADRREKARMEKEMEIARQIQHRMIPQQLPTCPGYDLAASFIPMDEAGGDIYDTIPVQIDTPEEGLILVLADAAGHGLGPALNVSQFRAMVRMGLRCSLDLQSLLGHVDRQLEDDLQDGRFVTAFLGLLELRKNRLEYLSYGQGPLLLFEAASETCRVLTSTDPPLGVSTDLPANSPITCTLEVGDVLVLLTDGYFESSNENGEMFGQPRVAEIVRHRSAEPAQAILDELRSSVWEFCGGTPGDDMTALIVKRTK